jgi:hypothetical protein
MNAGAGIPLGTRFHLRRLSAVKLAALVHRQEGVAWSIRQTAAVF